ncbi:MAG TPA: hypothetical protein DC039_08310 [Leclercia adecarboxylata]|nr:hypothetical protein [Leclercia adecarboxylata]
MGKWKWRIYSALYIFVLAIATFYAMNYIKLWYDEKYIHWSIAAALIVFYSTLSTVSRDWMNETDKNSALNAEKKLHSDTKASFEQEISVLKSKINEKDNLLHAFKSSFTGSFVSCTDEKELIIKLRGLATKIIDTPEMNNMAPAGNGVLEMMMKLR